MISRDAQIAVAIESDEMYEHTCVPPPRPVHSSGYLGQTTSSAEASARLAAFAMVERRAGTRGGECSRDSHPRDIRGETSESSPLGSSHGSRLHAPMRREKQGADGEQAADDADPGTPNQMRNARGECGGVRIRRPQHARRSWRAAVRSLHHAGVDETSRRRKDGPVGGAGASPRVPAAPCDDRQSTRAVSFHVARTLRRCPQVR